MPPCSLPVGARRSCTTVHTTRACEYLISLCRVWNHSLPKSGQKPTHVEVEVSLANGRVALNAGPEYLEIVLAARSRFDIALLEDLVSDHLDRLSSEELHYQWIGGSVQ